MNGLHLMVPFDDQCQRVLEILAIQKVVMPMDDLLWRVKPYTKEQLQFALDRIVEDKYADPSISISNNGRQSSYRINLRGVKFHAAGGYAALVQKKQQEPPPMTNEEKLNTVLRAYVEMGVGKGSYAYEMTKRFNLPIPAEEVVMLARHLEDEGYLEWVQLTRTTRAGGVEKKEKLTSKQYFTANIKGRMFLEGGGYKKEALLSPPVFQQTNTYNITGPAVVDNSSGRVGDNGASLEHTSTQGMPTKKHVIIRMLASVWSWLRNWWLMIVGPALFAWFLQLPVVNRKVRGVLNLNDVDSTSSPMVRDSVSAK